jgi:tRNA-uridine 2-sulfurtransferase
VRKKAISLVSGGLDSVLATKLIMEQGVEVVALHFTSPLTTSGRNGNFDERRIQAVKSCAELGIELEVKELGADYLNMVKLPRHGYGKNINPCIDCKIFMLRESIHFMEEVGATFVITGEVLGQRPMSQRREAMALIERESGLKGLILRPLSAHRFDLTVPETEGIVDRSRLLGITGRSRNEQYKLADKYLLNEFGCPAGGCLLTDRVFSSKLKDLFKHKPDCTMHDVALLKVGRHFRLSDELKLITSRDEKEHERLGALRQKDDTFLVPNSFVGPSALLLGKLKDDSLSIAAHAMAAYSKQPSYPLTVEVIKGASQRQIIINHGTVDLEKFKI